MLGGSTTVDPLRTRVRKIFEFLRAFDQIRNPVVCRLDQLDWSLDLTDLPASERVWGAYPPDRPRSADPTRGLEVPEDVLSRPVLLVVRRPKLSVPPPPPHGLEHWVEGNWREPGTQVSVRTTAVDATEGNRGGPERVGDDPNRRNKLEAWLTSWRCWSEKERPLWLTMELFSRLYALHGRLEREKDRIELAVGDGILKWRARNDDQSAVEIDYPVLLKRVELIADFKTPAFLLVEADSPVELNVPLLHLTPGLSGQAVADIHRELEEQEISPVGGRETSAFLAALVQRLAAQGEFVPNGAPRLIGDHPRLGRSPLLLVRSRSRGYSEAIRQVLEGLDAGAEVPVPIARVAGFHPGSEPLTDSPPRPPSRPGVGGGTEAPEILFAKPANEEQERIVWQLDKSDSVVVQGPPGTGKSHTIANLLGHLLAHGQSVLVTSHTEKALEVLRGHVIRDLQPLCLPVLTGDARNTRQLQAAVEKILSRLSDRPEELERQAAELRVRRSYLLAEFTNLQDQLKDVALAEYRPLHVGAETIDPADAAKEVREGEATKAWLPGPLEPNTVLPLASDEVGELYRTNLLSPEDEARLRSGIPQSGRLPSEGRLSALASQIEEFSRKPAPTESFWNGEPGLGRLETIQDLLRRVDSVTRDFAGFEPWEVALAELGCRGPEHLAAWTSFIAHLDRELPELLQWDAEAKQHGVSLPPSIPSEEVARIAGELANHLDRGGSLWKGVLLFHGEWKPILEGARTGTRKPRSAAQFRLVERAARLQHRRADLLGWWQRIAEGTGVPPRVLQPTRLEATLADLRPRLLRALHASQEWLEPLRSALADAGMALREFEARIPSGPGEGRLAYLQTTWFPAVRAMLEEAEVCLKKAKADRDQEEFAREVGAAIGPSKDHVAKELRAAVKALDATRYRTALVELLRLEGLAPILQRRSQLLDRLRGPAKGWAAAIERREGLHGQGVPPGDPVVAWRWRQMSEELARRDKLDPVVLNDQLQRHKETLQVVTGQLIEKAAWAAQIRRVTPGIRQSLIGWQDTVRRTPRTSSVPGKLEALRRQARENLSRSRAAVPVWIMPMSKVIESFDFRSPVFDVVIVDEASQNDVFGLLLLALGKKVVIVGDHEQVSPSSVGLDEGRVGRLVEEYLDGVPSKHLWNGKASIYDLARAAAGGTITLLEHFRCVPEIIAFSNELCYEGSIRPLREAASGRVRPALVPVYVRGTATGKVNTEEAEVTASLVAAVCQMDEYRGLSIGVVTLVGDEQALAIDDVLRRRLEPSELESRHLVCGNPAQLQGDERDVMFLSMVDGPQGGPLAFRDQPTFRQRFNVAVSRAKDQLWLVHSLDPEVDLKPGDLRYRLIKHTQNPLLLVNKLLDLEHRVESPLEKAVGGILVREGYKVVPQYPVGAYRIDLVVEGSGTRLAVECDGARGHTTEEEVANDLLRQGVLERLGWRFVRVRGSLFYRDSERAMQPVFQEIGRLGIQPELTTPQATPVDTPGLVEEVLRRAQGIREAWRGSVAPTQEPKKVGAKEVSGRSPTHEPRTASHPDPGRRPGPGPAQPPTTHNSADPPAWTENQKCAEVTDVQSAPPALDSPAAPPAGQLPALHAFETIGSGVWVALWRWAQSSNACAPNVRKFLRECAEASPTARAGFQTSKKDWGVHLLSWARRIGFDMPQGQESDTNLGQQVLPFARKKP